jgi:hypothetical protein
MFSGFGATLPLPGRKSLERANESKKRITYVSLIQFIFLT